MQRQSRLLHAILPAAVLALGACASKAPPPGGPTLKTLEGKTYTLPPAQEVNASNDATIAAYRDFLKKAPDDAQRPEALRRLGDLEMANAESRSAGEPVPAAAPAAGASLPQEESRLQSKAEPKAESKVEPKARAQEPPEVQGSRRAVTLYRELLDAYPQSADNDRVLYQLAHAYELGGDLTSAQRTLDRLVHDFPASAFHDESQFRRGELLFNSGRYREAEAAYRTIIDNPRHTPYFERSLYMHGWSLYKQDRLDEALQSFFSVLDLKLIARDADADLDSVRGLSRADREMVEDTLRVASLCLENLQGADSIPQFMGSGLRRDYEFRIYGQLGELYLKQDRSKDAADTFGAFVRRNPLHAQAPILQARVIDIYQDHGFDTLALDAKREYVERYGVRSEYHRANPAAWDRAQPRIKAYLTELAHRDHAIAQKSHKDEDYASAARWYREFLESFPADPQASEANFLLAELLFEDARYAEAAPEYEKTAYQYLPHPHAADAGYAALLAYTEQEKRLDPGARSAVQAAAVESAQRFGDAFPADPRAGPVLANAAEKLYALRDYERATDVAQHVLKLVPPAAAAQQRTAWTVIAHSAFDSGAFDRAESAYGEVLARTPNADPARAALTERLAASIYKQGEKARADGKPREAVALFARVGTVAPDSPVRATAQFDAAAVLIGLKDWAGAASTLQDFRTRYPGNPLQDEASDKLAAVYTESSQWGPAALEYERLSARKTDPEVARPALWQAAEFYSKAGDRANEARVYDRYLRQYPTPLEPAIEARYRLATIAKDGGDSVRSLAWMKDLLQADQAGGNGRTDRTRYLGATAALAMAGPVFEEYRKVALVEPLKKQLKLKKSRLEDVLKAYALAADYGVADVATAATFHTGELYQDFGKSLLASQRPKGLSKDELEQYDVLLEEQAYPFEEKAIALYESNARHAAQGIYDQWVRSSYEALAQLRPLRYGKSEQSEGAIDAIR